MRRRHVIGGVSSLAVTAFAGCVDDVTNAANGDGSDSGDNGTEGSGGEDGAEEAVEAFLEARAEADVDTQEQYLHDEAPAIDSTDDPADVTVHTIERRSLSDVDWGDQEMESEVETEAAAFEDHAFVYSEYETDEHGIEERVFLLADEAGSWHVYHVYMMDTAPTGEESTEQVDSDIEVVSAVGTVADAETVETVELTVLMTPGSSEVDLSDAELEFTTESDTALLTHGASSSDAIDTDALEAGTFGTVAIHAEDPEVLASDSDRIDIVFDAGGLQAGDTAEVTITLQSGTVTLVELNVPTVLDDVDAVQL